MTDERQNATKVKCKCDESTTKTFNIPRIYSFLQRASEFCWNLFAKDHKTFTIINQEKHKIKQVTFTLFGAPRLPDLLCKH